MSHEIVRSIRITDTQVIMSADSNNVSPRDYTPRVNQYFTTMLAEQGKDAVILEILYLYEGGMMQAGTANRYSRAIDILRTMPEYAAFDWRIRDKRTYNEDDPIQVNRHTNRAGLDFLLLRALVREAM